MRIGTRKKIAATDENEAFEVSEYCSCGKLQFYTALHRAWTASRNTLRHPSRPSVFMAQELPDLLLQDDREDDHREDDRKEDDQGTVSFIIWVSTGSSLILFRSGCSLALGV